MFHAPLSYTVANSWASWGQDSTSLHIWGMRLDLFPVTCWTITIWEKQSRTGCNVTIPTLFRSTRSTVLFCTCWLHISLPGKQWPVDPQLFATKKGMKTTQPFKGIVIGHYKDPYEPISISYGISANGFWNVTAGGNSPECLVSFILSGGAMEPRSVIVWDSRRQSRVVTCFMETVTS